MTMCLSQMWTVTMHLAMGANNGPVCLERSQKLIRLMCGTHFSTSYSVYHVPIDYTGVSVAN